MDEINPNNERDLENEPWHDSNWEFMNYLQSLGYDDESIIALTVIRSHLISRISELTSHNQNLSTENRLVLTVGSAGLRNYRPQEDDDVLLPAWKEFAKALASVPVHHKGYIAIAFTGFQLGQVVSDTLLASFKTLPLKMLALNGNDLGISGFKFVTGVLRKNSSLENLFISDNHITSDHDAISLMKAVREHPNVDMLSLDNCGIGHNNDIMEAVFPAASYVRSVSLGNNAIGSYGAGVIAACLARNPVLEELKLSDNHLDNKDSAMIALSLTSNSILRYLKVDGNHFTQDGVVAFIGAVWGKCLNECSLSNHTCNIVVGETYGDIGTHLSCMNKFSDPMLNKKLKLMSMVGLFGCKDEINNFHRIDGIPLEMMPKVLDFVQGERLMKYSIYNGLGKMFQVIREWSMPLLYTGCVYHKNRRSERIRENTMKKLKVMRLGLKEPNARQSK